MSTTEIARVTDMIELASSKVSQIENIYETFYISKSMLVCKSTQSMFYMKEMLSTLDHAVELLTLANAKHVLGMFSSHKIRMIVVNEKLFEIIGNWFPFIFNAFDTYFFDSENDLNLPLATNTFTGKKIFFV
jgi:hypothetical protein